MFRIDLLWARFVKFLFGVGAFILLAIVFVTLWDVIARNSPIHAPIWLNTFVEFALPIATMVAAPFLVRERGHVAMELIDATLKETMRQRLIALTDFVSTCICGLVAYYAALGGYDSFTRGEMVVLSIDVPRWILFAVLSVGFILCAIEFIRHLIITSCASVPNLDAED